MLNSQCRSDGAVYLPRTQCRAHTHLVCASEMRQKVSRSSSLYQSGAGARVWFTSCLCSKWTGTLLTSRPRRMFCFEVSTVHLQLSSTSSLYFCLREHAPPPPPRRPQYPYVFAHFPPCCLFPWSSLCPNPPQPPLDRVPLSPTSSSCHFPSVCVSSPPRSVTPSSGAVTRRSKLETCVTSSY